MYKPHRRIMQEWQQMHEQGSTTGGTGGSGDTAVLQLMQEKQLYLNLVQGQQYSRV